MESVSEVGQNTVEIYTLDFPEIRKHCIRIIGGCSPGAYKMVSFHQKRKSFL